MEISALARIELETKLSVYNAKSCSMRASAKMTTNYIKMKNEVNYYVYKHYRQEIYRKLKWYGFINRQKSEDKMKRTYKRLVLRRYRLRTNCFQKKFGKAENTIVCIGDWEPRKRIETYEILTTN